MSRQATHINYLAGSEAMKRAIELDRAFDRELAAAAAKGAEVLRARGVDAPLTAMELKVAREQGVVFRSHPDLKKFLSKAHLGSFEDIENLAALAKKVRVLNAEDEFIERMLAELDVISDRHERINRTLRNRRLRLLLED